MEAYRFTYQVHINGWGVFGDGGSEGLRVSVIKRERERERESVCV